MEENLRQTQARLEATAFQKSPAPTQTMAPAPASNPIVLAKPYLFDGTHGAAADLLARQIGIHSITYLKLFSTDSSKVAFAVLFMKDYTETWSQLYLDKWLCGTVLAYTQDFNHHARIVGWADTPLMSLYQHSLKENIQLAVVMSNVEFDSLRSMQAMALKAGHTIEGIIEGRPTPSTIISASAHNPNAMDLSTFQKAPSKRLSNTEQTCWVQRNLCFDCGRPHTPRIFDQGTRTHRRT
ncbi:uncharacterized protein VP01_6301g1 [Puccinia sorghi]|uniref:Uncharacterized protein n=1 Tax=Puccinia sorghi TaxID=27349 RepID=A0A0L6UID3_9BASI|nr:uncharacterized protein VP01_6301g1 [Puccinia sorghi]